MRRIISQYLPPDEWTIAFSWSGGGYHRERVRAGTYAEAEHLAEQMAAILKPALSAYNKLAHKSLCRGEWFDD